MATQTYITDLQAMNSTTVQVQHNNQNTVSGSLHVQCLVLLLPMVHSVIICCIPNFYIFPKCAFGVMLLVNV